MWNQAIRIRLLVLSALLSVAISGCSKSADKTDSPEPKTIAAKTSEKPGKPPAPKRPDGVIPRFTETAAAWGITFERYDDQRGLHRIIEANGGGVALFDFDRNGRLDVFFTSGCRLPRKLNDRTHPSQLFSNIDGRSFQRATEQAGLLSFGYATGCAVGDFDQDGFDDLYVAAFGQNSLWHNNGDGTFTDVTVETKTAVGRWSSSAAFADVNSDGVLDLYVVNYVETSDDPPKLCPTPGSPDGYLQCPPTMFRGSEDALLLGDGSGGFVNVTKTAGINGMDGKGLGVAIFDSDADGRPEIFVANDGVPNFLYVATKTRKTLQGVQFPLFEESAAFRGVAINGGGHAEASMGIACGDYDSDGDLDLFTSHFHAETNTLYQNDAGHFTDETSTTGLGAVSRSMTGWGTAFADFDNNGWLDLFVTNGHVDDFTWNREAPVPYKMRPQLFRNEKNGRFSEVSPWCGDYFVQEWLGRGAAVGDLDGDGDLDLVVSHQLSQAAVLRNDTSTKNHSVLLKLVGTGVSNRNAIGARVTAFGLGHQIMREVIGGGSYHSASDYRIHIGMGTAAVIPRLRVRWPSGKTEEWQNVTSGEHVVLEGRPLLIPTRAFDNTGQ